jgi:hypothetical protein
MVAPAHCGQVLTRLATSCKLMQIVFIIDPEVDVAVTMYIKHLFPLDIQLYFAPLIGNPARAESNRPASRYKPPAPIAGRHEKKTE